MKRRIILLIVVITCALYFSTLPAQAALITITIEAQVDSVQDRSDRLEGNISAGDIITGTYTYESTTPDTSSLAYMAEYWHYAPPAGFSLSVGGFDFQTDPADVEFYVFVRNNNPPGDDTYRIYSYNNLALSTGAEVFGIAWDLYDYTGTALSSDALPTTPPVLDDWQSGNRLLLFGRCSYVVEAHVTSAVPEPATIVLFAVGALLLKKRY